MVKKTHTFVAVALAAAIFSGCGSSGVSHGQGEYYGSSGSASNETPVGEPAYVPPPANYEDDAQKPERLAYGYFLDSAVWGLGYSCDIKTDFTDKDGKFFCPMETNVVFRVGKTKIGSYPVKEEKIGVVTPATALGHPIDEIPLYDKRFVTVVSLLQGLDSDGYPDNGLDLRENSSLLKESYDLTDPEEVKSFVSEYGALLADSAKAWRNYLEFLTSRLGIENYGIFTDPDIKKEWEWYGGTRTSLNLGNLYLDYHGQRSVIVFAVPSFPYVEGNRIGDCNVNVTGAESVFPQTVDSQGDGVAVGKGADYYAMIRALCEPRDGSGYAGILSGTDIEIIRTTFSSPGDLASFMDAARGHDPDAVVVSRASLGSYMPTEYEFNETNPELMQFPIFVGSPTGKVSVTESGRPKEALAFYPQTVYTVPLDREDVAEGYKNSPGDVAAPGDGLETTRGLVVHVEDMGALMAASAYVIGKERHPSMSWCNIKSVFRDSFYAVGSGKAGEVNLGRLLREDRSFNECKYAGPALPSELFADKGSDETPPAPPPPPPPPSE